MTVESNNGEILQQEPKGEKPTQSKTTVKLLKLGLQTWVKQQHLFTERSNCAAVSVSKSIITWLSTTGVGRKGTDLAVGGVQT